MGAELAGPGSAAAAGIATINSIGNLGGFVGPAMIGWIKERTGSFEGGRKLVELPAGATLLFKTIKQGARAYLAVEGGIDSPLLLGSRSTNQKAVLRQVIDNEVDMAIMGQPPKDSHVEAIAFMENPLVIVAPPEHRLAARKRIALKELEEEVFLIREPGSGTRGAMERFFRQEKLKLTTGMGMGSLSSIKQGVQAGLGLALLPRDAVRVELMLERLVELKIKGLPIPRYWYVVLHKGKRLSLAAEEFKLLLINEAEELLEA